jgi:hypothetical protein
MTLLTNSNFGKPDDAFRAVIEAHRGLSDEQSADLDAALVLILANHIGDLDVLRDAIVLAKRRMLDASQQQQQQQQGAHKGRPYVMSIP